MSEIQNTGAEQAVLKLMQQLASQAANEKTAEINNSSTFSNLLKSSLNEVNQHQMTSAKLQKSFEVGEATLPEVIVAMQKASVSFTAIKEVRNKLIDAYRQVMNMPV
ncbi:flagellar hook-basal body complex protein FliE [Piscirickettsia litoralis]|uniref:Flagellar hook-basal body complex protein FliE n=1 Tax=Piscirickettsia litoralis TaxID=1891921 RepID=A0ABX3A4X6_9GAMM|nr:flagellar hook-basal body complex protein FliE [Piscirickettsia litoralis]ODN42698.1 flagellar hook-basal body complex protein FliE [Piscirickettsia litoralis]